MSAYTCMDETPRSSSMASTAPTSDPLGSCCSMALVSLRAVSRCMHRVALSLKQLVADARKPRKVDMVAGRGALGCSVQSISLHLPIMQGGGGAKAWASGRPLASTRAAHSCPLTCAPVVTSQEVCAQGWPAGSFLCDALLSNGVGSGVQVNAHKGFQLLGAPQMEGQSANVAQGRWRHAWVGTGWQRMHDAFGGRMGLRRAACSWPTRPELARAPAACANVTWCSCRTLHACPPAPRVPST